MTTFGASGCLLLRASGEYQVDNGEIVALVRQQKREFFNEINRRVHCALGHEHARLSTQIWALFEGATAIAGLDDLTAIADARAAALSLLASAGTDR